MDAASLILLILLMIGVGLAFYYLMICYQFRPSKEKPPRHPDMGPLLNHEDDLNGNHEEPVGINISSRAIDEPDNASHKLDDHGVSPPSKDHEAETPLKAVTFQVTPKCASGNASNESSVVLPIDDEPSLLDTAKSVLPISDEKTITTKMVPEKSQILLQHSGSDDPHHVVVIPSGVSDSPRKAMSVSYEEDGLLVPRSQDFQAPQNPLELPSTASQNLNPRQHMNPQNNLQISPKHIQFTPIISSPPFFINPANHQETPRRPVLKSPHSDPGIVQDNTVFVFGNKHTLDENLQPVKRAKLTLSDCNIDIIEQQAPVHEIIHESIKEFGDDFSNASNRDPLTSNTSTERKPPPLGWSLNLSAGVVQAGTNIGLEKSDSFKETEENRLSNLQKPKDETDERTSINNAANLVRPIYSECQSSQNTDLKGINNEAIELDNESDEIIVKVSFPREEEEGRKRVSEDESESESSDPDVTEYSFQREPHTPDPAVATVLQNEMSCFPENKVGLTNYVFLPDPTFHSQSSKEKEPKHEHVVHPPTPTSDATSISPLSSNDNSMDEINPALFNPNVLGTPPVTPPKEENSPPFIIANPLTEFTDSTPSFIVIEPHNSRERLSSSTSTTSSSSSSSSSSSNGSYKLDGTRDTKNDLKVEKENSPHQGRLKK